MEFFNADRFGEGWILSMILIAAMHASGCNQHGLCSCGRPHSP